MTPEQAEELSEKWTKDDQGQMFKVEYKPHMDYKAKYTALLEKHSKLQEKVMKRFSDEKGW